MVAEDVVIELARSGDMVASEELIRLRQSQVRQRLRRRRHADDITLIWHIVRNSRDCNDGASRTSSA